MLSMQNLAKIATTRMIVSLLFFGLGASNAIAERQMGTLEGNIVGSESQQPLSNAAIVLCSVTAEDICYLKSDLSTTSSEDGNFLLSRIPSGSYIVFYDSSGKASRDWQKMDGKQMILKPCAARAKFLSTFGGGGRVLIKKGTRFVKRNGSMMVDGSFVSEEFGLTSDFHRSQPIRIEIQPGETTKLEIKAWGL